MKKILIAETDFERKKIKNYLSPIIRRFENLEFYFALNDKSLIDWLSHDTDFKGLIYNSPSINHDDPFSPNATEEENGLEIIKFLKTPKREKRQLSKSERKQYSKMKEKHHIYGKRFEKVNSALQNIPIFTITSDAITECMITLFKGEKNLQKNYPNATRIKKEMEKYDQAKKRGLIWGYGPAFNDGDYSQRFINFIEHISLY